MKIKGLSILLVIASAPCLSAIEPIAFRKVKMVDSRQRQVDADLILNYQSRQNLAVRVGDMVVVDIPYQQVQKLSYEYSQHHRIKQGAIVMLASLGAGAVVMLTKSKSHWFYVDYQSQGASKTIVLRLDKKIYKDVLSTAESEMSKQVAFLEDAKIKRPGGHRKGEAARLAPAAEQPEPACTVLFKSVPEGAEIIMNGAFVGQTPATLQVKTGEQKVLVKAAGFKDWERVVSLKGGNSITINATLEKQE